MARGHDSSKNDSNEPAAAASTIVGNDPRLLSVLGTVARIAPTGAPVLVTGESGTGKELLARRLHDLGPSPRGPFVAVNCGTLPRELADSELFGHERGAFTGAHGRKLGWFEEADGGTLVLDEVGELPLELQPKLLRVLETGRVRRVGGNGEVNVKVRLVALTLRDLPREVERGAFRLDLYHRLAGFEVTLPPLRERRGDLPGLVRRFLDELAGEMGPRTIDDAALARLAAHEWPGNVRELRNVVRRAALNCPRHIVLEGLELPRRTAAYDVVDHPGSTTDCLPGPPRLSDDDGPPAPSADVSADDLLAIRNRTFDEIERSVYQWALRRNGGSRRRAARALGLARSTFCDKVKRFGIA
ncbi:MAG TPA: sigma-54 dependent transcriptional regulator [Polyangia bacterium]|jgi:DNA-binding NtrC family response regulator